MNARLALLVLAACEHESVSRDPKLDLGSDRVALVTPDAGALVEPVKATVPSDAAVALADAAEPDASPPPARAPDAPKVAFFEDKNRKVLESIIDRNLSVGTLGAFTGGTGTTTPVKVDVGASTTTSDIDRVFKSRLGVIRACYAKELARKPGLGGKVMVRFQISATGAVQGATATGMDDAVTTCIVRQVERMKFTAPADGKVANVSYPLLFSRP